MKKRSREDAQLGKKSDSDFSDLSELDSIEDTP